MLFETIYGKNKNGTDVRRSKLVIWQLRETKFNLLDDISEDLRIKHAQISLLLLYLERWGFDLTSGVSESASGWVQPA